MSLGHHERILDENVVPVTTASHRHDWSTAPPRDRNSTATGRPAARCDRSAPPRVSSQRDRTVSGSPDLSSKAWLISRNTNR